MQILACKRRHAFRVDAGQALSKCCDRVVAARPIFAIVASLHTHRLAEMMTAIRMHVIV